ncbi:unnamed protein product, partial [Brenthis ino]
MFIVLYNFIDLKNKRLWRFVADLVAAIQDPLYRQVCSALEVASSLQCIHIDHSRSSSPSSLYDAAPVETMASPVTADDLAILLLLLTIMQSERKDSHSTGAASCKLDGEL